MFDKPFTEITIEDIKKLVFERKERENNHLEYKERLGNSDRDKKEFLKDVTGFANASGGFLVIGVNENKKDGLPKDICGIEKTIGNQKIDEWINNVLISNIDEKIRYEIKIFKTEDGKEVVVLYIPESPKKPHMVTFKDKNSYFLRHNTSVNPATQSEVREMFEYSKKNRDEFEEFLKQRNLFDERDENFGINENSLRLVNDRTEGIQIRKPLILYSFIPRYLDENRINTISQKLIDWLDKHSQGFEPVFRVKLFETRQKIVNLYGIVFPEISPYKENQGSELYLNYFEILNNGFFESGISMDVLWEHNKNPLLNLTRLIGYAWILFNFAKAFFQEIGYYDEIVFQLSIVNVKDSILTGFGKKNEGEKWATPFTLDYGGSPPRCSHEKFKIIEKFIVSKLSEVSIKEILLDLSEKVSRAFGESIVKCFDEEGNFNNSGMNSFRL